MLTLNSVSKRYGSYYAVKDLSLQVEPGEIFGFLGINGAGKTTTLRMITGILLPTAGTITIAGFDIVHDPIEAKSLTGFIPDRPHLYGKLRAREFLEFIIELYGLPLPPHQELITSLLMQYGLEEKQDQLIESFSHGMKQRLATCAALIHSPKLLVVDEPMVGLDPHGARLLKRKFREYAASGMTILLSTHSLNVAQEVCDRIAIIQSGSIIAQGSTRDVIAQARVENEDLEQAFLELTLPPDYATEY